MLDVTKMVKTSWSESTELKICRGCIKSDILPRAVRVELNETYGRMTNKSKQKDVKENVRMLSQLNSNIDRQDLFYEQAQQTVKKDDVTLWMGIEKRDEMEHDLVYKNLIELTQNNCNKVGSKLHVEKKR